MKQIIHITEEMSRTEKMRTRMRNREIAYALMEEERSKTLFLN